MAKKWVRVARWFGLGAIVAAGWLSQAAAADEGRGDAAAVGQGVRGGLEGFYDFVEPGIYAAREFLGGLFEQSVGKDLRHERDDAGDGAIPLYEQKAPAQEGTGGPGTNS